MEQELIVIFKFINLHTLYPAVVFNTDKQVPATGIQKSRYRFQAGMLNGRIFLLLPYIPAKGSLEFKVIALSCTDKVTYPRFKFGAAPGEE